ncbi:MAG: peptide deformylase, partial [Endomicrobiales bacterium]|nr:peptide deformylase [Endomicrobiales bacterium]
PMVFINPKIEKREGVSHAEEGCLSFPGIYRKIKRAKFVRVRALDENGKVFVVDAQDMLLSRALQHEIDHLNGKVLLDNLPPLQRQEVKKEIEIRKQENKW